MPKIVSFSTYEKALASYRLKQAVVTRIHADVILAKPQRRLTAMMSIPARWR